VPKYGKIEIKRKGIIGEKVDDEKSAGTFSYT